MIRKFTTSIAHGLSQYYKKTQQSLQSPHFFLLAIKHLKYMLQYFIGYNNGSKLKKFFLIRERMLTLSR